MTSLALGIYVFNQTGEVTPLALVALFSFLPQVLIGGFAGALADRWDRRYVMKLSDAGQALGTLILLVTFLTGSFHVEPALRGHADPGDLRRLSGARLQRLGDHADPRQPARPRQRHPAVDRPGRRGDRPGLRGRALRAGRRHRRDRLRPVHLRRGGDRRAAGAYPAPRANRGRARDAGSLLKESFGGLQFLWNWRTLFWLDPATRADQLPVLRRDRSCSRPTCWRAPAAKRRSARC